MTRTTYYTATTLDGFLADDQDSLEWLFTQQSDADGPMGYDGFIAGVGAVAMGRTTYDWILRHVVTAGEAWPYAIPGWVFTHHPPDPADRPAGADLRFVQGDIPAVHAEMLGAAGGRDVWVAGGGDLAAQFALAGLLDQIVVSLAPVTLGSGRPLFPRPFDLRLVELARNGSFACLRYDVVAPR